MSLKALDRLSTSTPSVTSNVNLGPNKEQTLCVMDIISEGPIYGLVEGESSVFLNGVRAVPKEQSSLSSPKASMTVSITNGSATATITGTFVETNPVKGTKYLLCRRVYNATAILTTKAVGQFALSTAGSFFTAAMGSEVLSPASYIARILNTGIEGHLKYNSVTSALVSSTYGYDEQYAIASGSSVVVEIDVPLAITSISGNTITLTTTATIPSGTYAFYIIGGQTLDNTPQIEATKNFGNVTTQFRVGNLHQPVVTTPNGVGVIAITGTPPGTQLENPGPAVELLGTTNFGLTLGQAKQVDEVRINFLYPNGLYADEQSEKGDSNNSTFAFYSLELAIKRGGVFSSYFTIVSERVHGNRDGYGYKGSITIEEIVNLEQYFPIEDFKIRVTRTKRHDGVALTYAGANTSSKYKQVATSVISSITSIIKEPLTYPYTAYSALTFSSREFDSVPTRTYHTKGKLVMVPSNYVTRDEASDGIAKYTRDSGGAITGSEQPWTGTLRGPVYTNNPAWVFYDLVIAKRYGLGNWVSADQVDIFTLYDIGRYCDELVPDINGGTEPRFTCNAYLVKAADCYKVLKDLATIFRSVIYDFNNQLTAVVDRNADPIYTFSRSNVINGEFNYESTGAKTRSNQVIVSWNNPLADYRLEPVIIEDVEDIVQTGRIISEEAVALGCTSEGQATRYGRWKLWTAKNQTEVVGFKSSLNAIMLTPGDIINIQDAGRDYIQYSGRIAETGTLSTTVVPLDRSIVLTAGSTYTLYIMTDHETVQSRTVTTGAGTVNSLTVSPAFSTTPTRGTIWALKEVNSVGSTVSGSVKQYKILGIVEEEKNIFGITAVEHYNEKFTAVDLEFNTYIPDTVYVPLRLTDSIPTPIHVYVTKEGETVDTASKLTLRWIPPLSTLIPNGEYPYTFGYEIQHPFPEYKSPHFVDKDVTSVSINNVPAGTYTIGVRTVSNRGTKSIFKEVTVTIGESPDLEVPRMNNMPIGGSLSVGMNLDNITGLFSFTDYNYVYAPAAAPFNPFINVSSSTPTYQQSCATLPAVNYAPITDPYEEQLASAYIMFDYSDAANVLKLVKYKVDDPSKIQYWYDIGTGNTAYTDNFPIATGTVSANGVLITGVGTTFTTDYSINSIIKFGSASSTIAGKVIHIESNTLLVIEVPVVISPGSTHYKQALIIDTKFDSIVAQIQNHTSGGFLKQDLAVFLDAEAILDPDYDALAAIGLDPPIDPELYVTLNPDRATANIRIRAKYENTTGLTPDMFVIFYSTAEVPNAIEVASDTGTKLYVQPATAIQGSYNRTVGIGSTPNTIVVDTELEEIDYSGLWWVSVNGSNFFKVTSATDFTLTIEDTLAFTPTAGQTVIVAEVEWADSRTDEFKLFYIDGEVVKHKGAKYDGQYYLDVVSRAREGTVQADRSNKTGHYFPAYGPLTNTIQIPIAEFYLDTDGYYTYSGNIPVVIESRVSWISITCCVARPAPHAGLYKFVRSFILPLTVKGPV